MEQPIDESDVDDLRHRLQRARWRMRFSAPGGPEWDAAMAAVESLEAELFKTEDPAGSSDNA